MHCQSMIEYGAPLEAREIETPEPEGHQVLVRISHCGVCHSDLHLHDGYFSLGDEKKLDVRSGRSLPFTLGHEISGTLEAAGPLATDAAVGTRYAVYPWIGCGDCTRCRQGDEHLCNVTLQLGITVDGGYASHVLVPHSRYLMDLEGIEPAFAGNLMCSGLTAYSALKKALPYLSDGPLMLVGMGGVGMMGLQIAQCLTDRPVVVAEIDEGRRNAALEAGAKHAFDPSDPDARKAVFKTCGAPPATIDFVGAESSFNFSQSVTAKSGAVVVSGLLGGKFAMALPMLVIRQLAVLGTFVGSLTEMRELMDLARAGKVKPIPVDLRPLDQANQALDDLRRGNVIGRIVLTP